MKSQREIDEASRRFLQRFGTDAPAQADLRAAELVALGDIDGQKLWLSIRDVTRKLLDRPGDTTRH